MKTPFDPIDPLLQSLTDEAADLPLKAAAEARRARTLRTRRHRQMALTLTVIFCGVCAWQMFPRGGKDGVMITSVEPSDAGTGLPGEASLASHQTMIVRTEVQAKNEPLPLPDGLTADQAKVVKAAHGLPLLLVRDRSGSVARIHLIER